MSVISLEKPEIPRKPLLLFSMASIRSGAIPLFLARYSKTAGSMSPERVLMIRPELGEKPMEVSTETPFLTAMTLAPPVPRWQTIIFNLLDGTLRSFGIRLHMYEKEIPWNPNRRNLKRPTILSGNG